jgi:hypothetical protein
VFVKKNAVRVRLAKPLWVLGFVAFAFGLYALPASSIARLTCRHKVIHTVAAAFDDG